MPKRKRSHASENTTKDLNGYKVDVKRQRNQFLPPSVEMAGLFTSLHIEHVEENQPQQEGRTCQDNEMMSETDEVQSKLGQLRLHHQSPETTLQWCRETETTTDDASFSGSSTSSSTCSKPGCSSVPFLNKIQANAGRVPTSSRFKRDGSVLDSIDSQSMFQESDDVHVPSYSLQVAVPDTENNWQLPRTVNEETNNEIPVAAPSYGHVMDGRQTAGASTSSQRNQRSNLQFSRHCRGRSATLPPPTYSQNNNNLDLWPPSSGNHHLFSVSPDMMNIPLSGYGGLPLIPRFARIQQASVADDASLADHPPAYNNNNNDDIVDGMELPPRDIGNAAGDPPDWDDEGFDEPFEGEASAVQHLAMSDIEEDLANGE